MQTQVWASLIGVALGGGLSYLAQSSAARLASRNEERRERTQLAETRRAERLELLRDFIRIAQEGQRVAEEREFADDWQKAGTNQWFKAARGVVDRLFVCERVIQVLFPSDLHQRAWDYATAVDHVMWRQPDEIAAGGVMWDLLQAPQRAFLAAAREGMG